MSSFPEQQQQQQQPTIVNELNQSQNQQGSGGDTLGTNFADTLVDTSSNSTAIPFQAGFDGFRTFTSKLQETSTRQLETVQAGFKNWQQQQQQQSNSTVQENQQQQQQQQGTLGTNFADMLIQNRGTPSTTATTTATTTTTTTGLDLHHVQASLGQVQSGLRSLTTKIHETSNKQMESMQAGFKNWQIQQQQQQQQNDNDDSQSKSPQHNQQQQGTLGTNFADTLVQNNKTYPDHHHHNNNMQASIDQVQAGFRTFSTKFQETSNKQMESMQSSVKQLSTRLKSTNDQIAKLVLDGTAISSERSSSSNLFANQLDEINKRFKEEKERQDVIRQSEAACLQAMESHLMEFLQTHGSKGTYDQWIEEFHPENAHDGKLIAGLDKEIDFRFYIEESDHRKLWNSKVGPDRQILPRGYMNKNINDNKSNNKNNDAAVGSVVDLLSSDTTIPTSAPQTTTTTTSSAASPTEGDLLQFD